MAITLDATVGGANANTYITLSDANTFIEGLVLNDDTVAWDNSSTDNKNRALFTAAQRIDREKFLGARVADTQALEWPRSGVRKPDTYTNLYGLSFPNRLVADYYLDTEIPDRVKHADPVFVNVRHSRITHVHNYFSRRVCTFRDGIVCFFLQLHHVCFHFTHLHPHQKTSRRHRHILL